MSDKRTLKNRIRRYLVIRLLMLQRQCLTETVEMKIEKEVKAGLVRFEIQRHCDCILIQLQTTAVADGN
jgi:hypothetical protein